MCGERARVLTNLAETYSEAPVSMGLASNGSVIEVLASPSGSFTIILTQPNGVACVMAAGESWENLPFRATEQKISAGREFGEPRPLPALGYEVGDIAPFNTMCQPAANGVVLFAFMEGGPELADAAFDERERAGECSAYDYMMWGRLVAFTYHGAFHGYDLWSLRFGERGFVVVYRAVGERRA